MDFVEYVEEHIAEHITPRFARIRSTMNRHSGMIRSLITEIKCCWEQGSWGWAKTVLGPYLLQPQDEDSEWAFIIKCWKTWTFGPLLQLFLLSFGSLLFPPMGFFLFMYLWERSVMTEVGREFRHNNEANKDRWIFVNGMCLDNNLGGANATQLSKLFQRQVGFFHNPTQGLLFDLFECMVGRTFSFQTPVSRRLAKSLTRYLLNDHYERVVLVCHSQGGIIASSTIALLLKRKVVGLNKLEVYTFGSAADEFAQVYDPETGQKYPFYEHYANEGDYISKIGTLHWDLPGNVFALNRTGHFLGDHYLPDFKRGLYKIYSGPCNSKSRMYTYVPDCNKPPDVLKQEEEDRKNMAMRRRRSSVALSPRN